MRVVASLLWVPCLVLVLSACGGSSDDDAGPGDGGTVAPEGGARERVRMRTPGGTVDVDSGVDLSALGVTVPDGASLYEGVLSRVSAGCVSTMSGTFRTSMTVKEIVAFFEKELDAASVVEMDDGAMVTAERGEGEVVQVVCSALEDSDEREFVVTVTRGVK